MEITPYNNFDRYNEGYNRKAQKVILIVFGTLAVVGISILVITQYQKKKKEYKSSENQTNAGNEQ